MPKNQGSSAGSGRSQGSSTGKTQKEPTPKKKAASGQRYAERQARKDAAAAAARQQRNRRYAIFTIALVLVIVVVLVVVKVAGGGGGGGTGSTADVSSPPAGTPIPAATLSKMASVPLSTLAAASTSGIDTHVQPISPASTLTQNGKNELLYVGAEWCPFCGAERWAMYVALSKFGSFSPGPGRIHSAVRDGNVPTLTFYGTTYTSPYFVFNPRETYTNHPDGDSYVPLQTLTSKETHLWQTIAQGSYPFVDFGGQEALVGAQYSFASLSGLSFDEVATQVGDNNTQIGADIDASAYQLIGVMCRTLSSKQPASVCSNVNNG